MGNMIRKERGRIMRVRTRDSGQRSWIPFKQWERDVSPMLFLIESLSDEPGHHISPPHPSFPSNKRVQCAFLPPSSLSLSDSRWLWDSGPVWERWPGIRLALCLSASVCERHFRVSQCEIIRVGVWESWYLKGFNAVLKKDVRLSPVRNQAAPATFANNLGPTNRPHFFYAYIFFFRFWVEI